MSLRNFLNCSRLLFRAEGQRRFFILASVILITGACSNKLPESSSLYASSSPEEKQLKSKFSGIYGIVLRIDASGTEKYYNSIKSDNGTVISSASLLSLENVKNQTYTDNSMPIPKKIRAIWYEGDIRDQRQGLRIVGKVLGDYTVPVAERIPDEIINYIRKNGGALRIKIRLKDNGVAIGWDVEERYITNYGKGVRWVLPGGDFREAQVFNGKITDPGWEN